MPRYTNTSSLPLSIAVFLATDNYDYSNDPNTISVTTLLKPLRQIILGSRVPPDMAAPDLTQMVQSRMGNAIHEAIEMAWKKNYRQAMLDIGIPQRVVDAVYINPTPEQLALDPDAIPVYLEQRSTRKVGKWTVSGKFDFVGEGRLEDIKSTSTFTAQNATNDSKYILQGSLYRWLNPEIITKDEMAIQWIFTDWSAARARSDKDKGYPQSRHLQKLFPLKSLHETQRFVEQKLALIEQYWDAPEDQIPECNDEDLWRSAPVYKFYKNGDTSAARSTKNFDTLHEARMFQSTEHKGAGAIKEVPGQAVACRYCEAFIVCSQKDRLIATGDLVL